MRSRDGYALIAALWLLVLVSALSLDAAHAARGQRLLAAGLVEGSQARFAAASGLEHAHARLTSLARRAESPGGESAPLLVDPWHDAPALMPDTVEIGDSRYVVTARDANAVVNLNRADEAQIRALLVALRVDARLSSRVAQAVLDWRDADDFRRIDGAERDEYLKESMPLLPANGPLTTIDDLRHVLGMSDALFARVAPYVGTEGSGRININTAAAPVLAAIPGMSDEAVAVILRERSSGRVFRTQQELLAALPDEARARIQRELARFLATVVFESRDVEVTSTGWVEGSPVRVRAVAILSRGGGSAIMTWRRSE